jgi:exopolysaccharide biosynthesis protein
VARLNTAVFLFLFLAQSVHAEWTVTTSETDKGATPNVEHRQITLRESSTENRVTINLAVFSMRSSTLRVIDNPSAESLETIAKRGSFAAGVNGGYFDPENKPVGLMISRGTVVAPLRRARLLSGVMIVSAGRLDLLRTTEYSATRKASEALQCGPFLVDRGQVIAGLNNTRSARRTFVAIGESDQATIGSCSGVTLAELGRILATRAIASDLGIRRALNLDGGSSSGFWFAGEQGPILIPEQKTVRNFVMLVPK